MLLADRVYPSANLSERLMAVNWPYRLRLRGNRVVDIGCANICTTGDLAAGVRERHEAKAYLCDAGIPTAIGVPHEASHPEPWVIAMASLPKQAAIRDYGLRGAIEPMFSDFKSRGFRLQNPKLGQVPVCSVRARGRLL